MALIWPKHGPNMVPIRDAIIKKKKKVWDFPNSGGGGLPNLENSKLFFFFLMTASLSNILFTFIKSNSPYIYMNSFYINTSHITAKSPLHRSHTECPFNHY